MSYGVAVNTRLVGAVYGDFQDDLTNRMSFPTSRLVVLLYNTCILANVGEWPKDLAIRRISKIVVHAGYIVDGFAITYELTNGNTVTVQHGGTGGGERLNRTLAGDFLFYLLMSEAFLTSLESQKTRKSSLFMVAGSMKA